MDEVQLDDLIDPDSIDDNARYTWDEDFQRHIISMLISDRQFLLHGMNLVKPGYFTNKAHSKICSKVFKYFEKHKNIPDRIVLTQEIKDDLSGKKDDKENKTIPFFIGELNALYDYYQPGLDAREYLTDKIAYFAKIQSLKKAFNESLNEIQNDPESPKTWGHCLQHFAKSNDCRSVI